MNTKKQLNSKLKAPILSAILVVVSGTVASALTCSEKKDIDDGICGAAETAGAP